ncbi:MAG TPA: DUF397 domain-containing protein [Actinophytocola sp.]|jgi:hypothetical protein|uniref:DUF397 domain-containing protein n=1 Tax=Actinophytocola sp. TaxID=1872138 RepID=UPI002DF84202|nr:DUF397 domain-containing protein [Actinophytocola sp.]
MINPEAVPLVWRTSRRSQMNNACVEVAITEDLVRVRDSKLTRSPILAVGSEPGQAFLEAVKLGRFDRRATW